MGVYYFVAPYVCNSLHWWAPAHTRHVKGTARQKFARIQFPSVRPNVLLTSGAELCNKLGTPSLQFGAQNLRPIFGESAAPLSGFLLAFIE